MSEMELRNLGQDRLLQSEGDEERLNTSRFMGEDSEIFQKIFKVCQKTFRSGLRA
jgi:hypothetical protein